MLTQGSYRSHETWGTFRSTIWKGLNIIEATAQKKKWDKKKAKIPNHGSFNSGVTNTKRC